MKKFNKKIKLFTNTINNLLNSSNFIQNEYHLGIGIGISPVFRKKIISGALTPILRLFSTLGKTGNPISLWADQSGNNNNAVTGIGGVIDNNTFLTFDGASNLNSGNNAILTVKDKLTMYAKFRTTSATNFMGFFDKWISNTGGYVLGLSSTKTIQTVTEFSKTSSALIGTNVLNDGVIRKIFSTVNCTRKFFNKQYLFDGELPNFLKVGNEYWVYYDKYNGTNFDVFLKKGTTPTNFYSNTLILSGYQYARVTIINGVYRMFVSISGTLTTLKLFTSNDGINFSFITNALVVGIAGSFDDTYVDNASDFKLGNVYYLYYEGWSGAVAKIGYATSSDGINYTKQGIAINNDSSSTLNIDYTGLADPSTIIQYTPNNYLMFYTPFNSTVNKQQQTFATSTDLINWTKYSGGAIHFFTGETFENGIYGPNEFSVFIENGIYKCYYRCDNTSAANCKIGYVEFSQDPTTKLPISGNETITTQTYINNILESQEIKTGVYGIDYILPCTQSLIIGGDNVSTLPFNGDIYELEIYNNIKNIF